MKDQWTFIPVNSNFIEGLEGDNIKPEQFRTKEEIENYLKYKTNTFKKCQCDIWAQDLDYYKLEEVKYSDKPMYITQENFSNFVSRYSNQQDLMQLFFTPGGKFYDRGNKGFYFVRTKEELKWCADRVNGVTEDGEKSDSYNNFINIVLGDDIGEDKANTIINFTIGKFPDRPFNGLLYGNGYIFNNLSFNVVDEVGGIVGHLGHYGLIDSINIYGDTKVTCDKKLNLTHIKQSANDICFGILCGQNFGMITNCRYSLKTKESTNTSKVLPKVTFKGFIPSTYLVHNKTEDTSTPVITDRANEFFPSYFCINSPGNIVPYVGYFAEGVPSFVYDNENTEHKAGNFWLNGTDEWNTDWGDTLVLGDNLSGHNEPSNTGNNNTKTIGIQYYFDGNNATQVAQSLNTTISSHNFGFDSFFDLNRPNADHYADDAKMKRLNWRDNKNSNPWSDHSIKMHQNARAAYYISPFVGWNKGTLNQCESKSIVEFIGTFVGFCGGLCGKLSGGSIFSCNSYIQPTDDVSATRDIFVSSASDSITDSNMNYITLNSEHYAQTLGFSGEKYLPFSGTVALDLDIGPSGDGAASDSILKQYQSMNYFKNAILNIDEDTSSNSYMDRFGIAACPWFQTTDGLFFQFEGLKTTSGSKLVHEITFYGQPTLVSSTSAADFVKSYINDDFSSITSWNSEMSTDSYYDTCSATTTYTPVGSATIHCHRVSEEAMNNIVNSDDEPIYDTWYNAWFPMLNNNGTHIFDNLEWDAAVGAYVIKNVEFEYSYGYTIVAPYDYKGSTISNHPDFLVDAVYPDLYGADKTVLNKVAKQNEMNYSDHGEQRTGYPYVNSFFYNGYKLSAFSADENKINVGYEIKSANYTSTWNEVLPFINSMYCVPKITIEKMYLRPVTDNTYRSASNKDNKITKLVEDFEPAYYIQGNPLFVYRVEGMHIKTICPKIEPRTSIATSLNTKVTIEIYETYIKELEYNRNNGANVVDYVEHKKPDGTTTQKERHYIWDCNTGLYDLFMMNRNENSPYENKGYLNELVNAYVERKGESFVSYLQSIYNIGAVAGSIAAAPHVSHIYNTSAFLDNKISEGLGYDSSACSAYDWTNVDSKNYMFLNRFGTLAAIYELNSSNLSDNQVKPIDCQNNFLQYNEEEGVTKPWDLAENKKNNKNYGRSREFYGPVQLNGTNPTCPFGIGSPLVAEIKPTYNMFPSINSFIGPWWCKDLEYQDNGVITNTKIDCFRGKAYYGLFTHDLNLMYNQFNDGIYTMDMNVDTPIENEWFRHGEKICNEWFPRTNTSQYANTKDIANFPYLAQYLFNGNTIKAANWGYVDDQGTFHQGKGWRRTIDAMATVHYPAQICWDCSDTAAHPHVMVIDRRNQDASKLESEGPSNCCGAVYESMVYPTAKHESNYSIFGSSLQIYTDMSGKRVANNVLISYNDTGACPETAPDLTDVKLPLYNKNYFKANNGDDDIFNYTYSANYDKSSTGFRKVDPLKYEVNFANVGSTIGYWLQSPEYGIKGADVQYDRNVIHYGLTKHPKLIRQEIMENKICKTSGISAEDFQGLYVVDSQGNNVMYIDTKVGDLNGLQAWSWSLPHYGQKENEKGCVLEIK